MLGRLNLFHSTVRVTGAVVIVDGSVFDGKSSPKMLGLSFFSVLGLGLVHCYYYFLFSVVSFL